MAEGGGRPGGVRGVPSACNASFRRPGPLGGNGRKPVVRHSIGALSTAADAGEAPATGSSAMSLTHQS